MRTLIRSSLTFAAINLVICAVHAQQQMPTDTPLAIDKVRDTLYNISGGTVGARNTGNVGALVTNEGIILIDDKFEHNYEGMVAILRSVTNQPVRYVINTHYHADHSGGNVKFLPGAEIISTANARKNILEHKQPNAPPNMTPARIVFTEETSVFLGGIEVRARFFGRGHTDGDAVIYFPQLRTIHTGDLMSGNSPLIDYNGGGSIVAWTKTLDEVLKLDFDTVIPGHGAVTNKTGLQAYRDNIEKLRIRVSGLIREEKSEVEIRKVLNDEFGWTPSSLNIQRLPGLLMELR
jgi:cyclase